jgi:hypothetical protein
LAAEAAVRLTLVAAEAADKLLNQSLPFLVRSPLWSVQVAQLATTALAMQRAAAVRAAHHQSLMVLKP